MDPISEEGSGVPVEHLDLSEYLGEGYASSIAPVAVGSRRRLGWDESMNSEGSDSDDRLPLDPLVNANTALACSSSFAGPSSRPSSARRSSVTTTSRWAGSEIAHLPLHASERGELAADGGDAPVTILSLLEELEAVQLTYKALTDAFGTSEKENMDLTTALQQLTNERQELLHRIASRSTASRAGSPSSPQQMHGTAKGNRQSVKNVEVSVGTSPLLRESGISSSGPSPDESVPGSNRERQLETEAEAMRQHIASLEERVAELELEAVKLRRAAMQTETPIPMSAAIVSKGSGLTPPPSASSSPKQLQRGRTGSPRGEGRANPQSPQSSSPSAAATATPAFLELRHKYEQLQVLHAAFEEKMWLGLMHRDRQLERVAKLLAASESRALQLSDVLELVSSHLHQTNSISAQPSQTTEADVNHRDPIATLPAAAAASRGGSSNAAPVAVAKTAAVPRTVKSLPLHSAPQPHQMLVAGPSGASRRVSPVRRPIGSSSSAAPGTLGGGSGVPAPVFRKLGGVVNHRDPIHDPQPTSSSNMLFVERPRFRF